MHAPASHSASHGIWLGACQASTAEYIPRDTSSAGSRIVSNGVSGRGGRVGSSTPIAGINHKSQARTAPNARRIRGRANSTTPINTLISSVVRINQSSIAVLELGENLLDRFDVALGQLALLRKMRDQRRHLTAEETLQEPFGFLRQHRLARHERPVEETTAVPNPSGSLL